MGFTEYHKKILSTDQFVLGGGIKVAISDSGVEISSLTVGKLYVIAAVGGAALMRQSTDTAVSSNGNFDVCIPAGGMIRHRATDTTYNFIEADASSEATAAVYIAEIDEDISPVDFT